MSKIEKAYAITDAKISFVSLVDKAANKKQFLITKAEHGSASFASYGRILNADADSHYITGIVYEPLTEDAHGNYMTEQEITKAAYWFAKNGNQVDVQHSFEPLEKAAVVESYVAPCDMSVGEQAIKKGTWMMTVEVDDPDIFEKVQKGEITGFSMHRRCLSLPTAQPSPIAGTATMCAFWAGSPAICLSAMWMPLPGSPMCWTSKAIWMPPHRARNCISALSLSACRT